MSTKDFEPRVVAALRRLGEGELATYGEIAEEAGFPGAARADGNLLSKKGSDVPWWRVVRSDGSLAARDQAEQARLLEAEGIAVREGRALPRKR